MQPIKFKTKYFTLEIFRRGIVFTIASLLFASGVNLCNGNIFLLLISIFNKQVYNQESNEYGFWVGLLLVFISLFLYYLIIINWRVEIYSKVFVYVRKTVDVYATAVNHRMYSIGPEELTKVKDDAHKEYLAAFAFLGENQTLIDVEVYNLARSINHQVGELIIEFDFYISEVEKIVKSGTRKDYDPDLANRTLRDDMSVLNQKFEDFVLLIKQKEKFKISSN